MKKIFSIALVGVAMMSLVGCANKNFDDQYPDPAKTATASIPNLFTGVLQAGNQWMNATYWRYYTQSSTSGRFAGINDDSNSRGRFRGASEGYYNIRWQNYYNQLTQVRIIERMMDDEKMTAKDKELNMLFYHLAKVVMAAQTHEMLSLFGPIPYRGAGTLAVNDYATAKDLCAYDNDAQTYTSILGYLKNAADYLVNKAPETSLTNLKNQDWTMAAGDQDRWRRFTNTLRLRIALHLATRGEVTAAAHATIKEVIEDPNKYPTIYNNNSNQGVTGSTENDTFNFGKGMSQAMRTGGMSNGSANVLRVMNVPANGIPDENTDPRLQAMYDPNPDGEYIGYDLHMTNSEIDDLSTKKTNEYKARKPSITMANYFCQVDTIAIAGWASYEGNTNLNSYWATAAETHLLMAEAYAMGYGVAQNSAKAKEHFCIGVELSNNFYWDMKEGSSLAKSTNDSYRGFRYLERPTDDQVAAYAKKLWDTSDATDQEKICTQRWLHYGYINYLEAWNVVRRTGFPVINFAEDAIQTDYNFPPNRLPYPSDESDFNRANYEAAVAQYYKVTNGGYYTVLFWAKEDGKYYNIIDKK